MSMNVARPHGPGPKMGGRMDQRGGGPRGPPNRNQTPNRNQGFQNRNQGDRNHGNQVIKQENKDKDNGTPSHRPRGDREKNERNQNQSEQNMEEDEPVGAGKKTEKKFTQRCRLFVGNLTPDTTEDQFKEMFRKYGEVSEVFLNTSKGFGFIRLDTRLNAETAKAELDGIVRKGRTVRVRFATHGAALRVKNIPQSCSNELLAEAFAQFGVVERAVVIVDDRGRPTGEGIVEFARKPGAQNALQKIREGVFLLSALPTPISAEPLEQKDEEDGQQEKNIQKNQQYHRERDAPPRFAQPGSFEHKWGMQWKHLEESEKMQRQQLERSFEDNRAKMEEDIEISKREHQAELMRQDLQRRQAELIRLEEAQKEFLQRRQQMQQQREEQMLRQQQQQQEEAVVMRRRQDEMRLQQDIRRRGGNDDMGSRDQAMQRMRGGMNQSKGMGAGGPGGMMGSGSGGGNGNGGGQGDNANQGSGGMGQGFMQQRQSRFDQPPGMGGGPGGRGGNAGPGGRGPGGPGGRGPGGPGGPSGMGGPGFGGPRGGMDEGPMRGTRRPPMDRPDMERGGRDRGDDYGKRPRRF